jgi:twitching motility protein PilT
MAKIDALFDDLLAKKGSDLHLAVGYPPLFRLRGELVPAREKTIDTAEMEALLFEIVNPEQKKQIMEELDLDFAYQHTKARFRANYLHRMAGIGAVFRFIQQGADARRSGCPPAIKVRSSGATAGARHGADRLR